MSLNLSRRAFLGGAAAGALVLRAEVARALSAIVPIFLYPPAHKWPSGRRPGGSMALDLAQITTEIMLPPEGAGVALSFFWDHISRAPGEYDYSMIDQALEYWGRRGKKVIVSVATFGFEYRANGETDPLRTPTPDWVMQRVSTYRHQTRVLGAIGEPDVDAIYPDFRDERFVALGAELAHRLGARYDGNPTIAQWRIATGMGGEDNSAVGNLNHPMANYNEAEWVTYTERAVQPFYDAFRRTELEFDIGRLSAIARLGNGAMKQRVQRQIDDLRAHNVLFAFDGLQTASLDGMRNPKSPVNLVFEELRNYQAAGGQIGLEAVSPFFNSRMRDADAMLEVVSAMKPKRLVFFHDMGVDVMDPRAANAPGSDVARDMWSRLTRH